MSADDIKLLPLPAPDHHEAETNRKLYIPDQMQAYARAAIQADRASRAPSPQGDAERLEYLMRRLSGAAIRYYVGELGDTGSLDDFRTAIDTRRANAGSAQQPAGTNTGHGHVFPRPDGVRARCGGPGICAECSRDAARSTPAKGGE